MAESGRKPKTDPPAALSGGKSWAVGGGVGWYIVGGLFLLGIASVACPAAVHPKQREGEGEGGGVETSSPGDAETTGDAPGKGFARFRARFKRDSISILL